MSNGSFRGEHVVNEAADKIQELLADEWVGPSGWINPDFATLVERALAAERRATVERIRPQIQHVLGALNEAFDKMGYGDSVESDLLEAHATLESLLDSLAER